ncbi:MAG TPA: hypothetical protein VF139_01920 [Candidatus Polarisedimenticolaceae bacterium]
MTGRSAAAALALVALAPIAPARAARVPDWVRVAADSAPPLPEGVAEHPALVLSLDVRLEVGPNGSYRIRQRRIVQALRVRAQGVGVGSFYAGGERKVARSQAWHLPPDDKAQKTREAFEVTLSDSFLSDDASRVVAVDGVKKGSVVAFEFEATERPWTLTERIALSDPEGPIRDVRVEIVHPAGWTVRHAWLGGTGAEPSRTPVGAVFELRDVPPIPENDIPLGPDPAESALRLVLGFDPPEGAATSAPPLRGWEDLARWFSKTAAGSAIPGEEVRRAAAQVPLAKGDFARDVEAAGRFVRDRVRYITQDVGIGGYRPRPAEETVRTLYGDCKDKGTLLQSILETASIRAHPVLVHATQFGTVARDVPDLAAFNHLVAAVEVPDGTSLPPGWEDATIPGRGSARLLIVDATDDRASIGWIPAGLSGKTALVVDGEGGRLVDLPLHPPRMHRVERRLELERQPDGGWRAADRRLAFGEYAAIARAEHRNDPSARRRDRESDLRHRWPAASVESYTVRGETPEGAFEDVLAFTLPSLGNDAPFSTFWAAMDELPKPSLRRRQEPVVFGFPRTLVVESVVPGWPAAAPLPDPVVERGEGWTVESRFERVDGGVRGRLDARLERTRFAPDAFPELKRFYDAIAAAQSTPIPVGW